MESEDKQSEARVNDLAELMRFMAKNAKEKARLENRRGPRPKVYSRGVYREVARRLIKGEQ